MPGADQLIPMVELEMRHCATTERERDFLGSELPPASSEAKGIQHAQFVTGAEKSQWMGYSRMPFVHLGTFGCHAFWIQAFNF